MKTNQIMVRKMGGFSVNQRTKDGFFNATALLRQWNDSSGQQKQMSHYTDNLTTQEFLKALMSEENLKERDSVLLQSRGKNGGTWMHPIVFVDFAMWLNPSFKVKVIKFVYDQMIAYRNEAGDAYKELAAAVAKITPKHRMQDVMSAMGRAVNIIAKGTHKKMLRNDCGDEKSQKEYVELERKIAMLINEGFISNLQQLDYYIHRLLGDKYKLPQIK